MENFESILLDTEKSLNNIRVSLIKKTLKKIEDLAAISLKENFWKDKNLVKKL